MATVAPREPRLRPEVDRLLDRLRARIRSYVAAEGAAVVLVVLGGLFWLTLLLDLGYFRLTNLELPVPVRATVVILAVALTAAAAVTYLALRLARRLRARALALVLERRFPELNDRLILAVETAERLSGETHGPLEEAMLSRAVDDVAVAADRLDVTDVFDRRPLRRATIAAAVLLVPILVLAVARPRAIAGWWDAYGRLADTYHARETTLRLTVLAPPDERLRPLEPGAVYKHPRGANLAVLLEVPGGKRPDGKLWAVPETVYARRRTDAGGRQTLPAVKAGERSFRLTVEEVRDGMELWVTGGDYTSRSPYRIEVVDPPRVNRVELHNIYPGYTGLNDLDADDRPVADRAVLTGPVAEVPAGTLVSFRATANKPIRNARVRIGEQELVFGEFDRDDGAGTIERASLTLREGEAGLRTPLPSAFAKSLLTADRRGIVIPLLVTAGEAAFLDAGPKGRPDLPQRPAFAVPLETPIRVTFEDTDLVASLEPSRFDLRGKVDEPPKVETELRGVGSIITRTAVVPVRGTIRDDHGIVSARFDFKIDAAEEWTSRPLANPPAGRPKAFSLRRDASTAAEWLDTATLDLKVGQKLTVAVAAEDGDVLTGPHLARDDQYVFTIVTPEELLSALYNHEIDLRKRFEQSLSEMKAVRQDLAAHLERAAEVQAGRGGERDAEAIRSAADRAYSETQQNANDVRAVRESFGGILEQLVNNRVHTEKQLERIRLGILDPLERLTDERFPTLDRAVGELRLRIADAADPQGAFHASLAAADSLITDMEAALQEMQDLAEFHEAVQDLNQLFEDERALKEKTEEEQKRSVIDTLGDLLE
jgi:hypothetical protein